MTTTAYRPDRSFLLWLSLLVSLMPFALVASGSKTFEVWDQILDLVGSNPFELLFAGQAHALRFIIMQPCLLVAGVFRADIDLVFSWLIAGLIVILARLVAGIVASVSGRSSSDWIYSFPTVGISLTAISLFQNGRLIFAFVGCALMVYGQVRWYMYERRSIGMLLLGGVTALILLSVSSGSFMVGILTWLLFVLRLAVAAMQGRNAPDRKDLGVLISFAGVAIAFIPVIIIFVTKNLDYFGGGLGAVIPMLAHGPGAIFLEFMGDSLVTATMALAMITAVCLIVVSTVVRLRSAVGIVWLPILASLLVGPFGYSTLITCMPAVLSLVVFALPSVRFGKRSSQLVIAMIEARNWMRQCARV